MNPKLKNYHPRHLFECSGDETGGETSDDGGIAWALAVLAILFIACLVASIVYLSREKKDTESTASRREEPQGVPSAEMENLPVPKGIAATYLLNDFVELARERVEVESPNFYDLTILSYGPIGLGYQKRCPRDGQLGCSIVDAINECYKGEASYFVSWCWQYKLNDFVSAISSWVQREGVDPSDAYLWVCFFCNNQYRILEEQTQHGSSQLTSMFEHHLASAGRMLVLLDSFVEPLFLTRAWCLFECYVSADQYIPMTITFPDRLRTEATEGRQPLEEAIQALDMRRAKASDKVDEENMGGWLAMHGHAVWMEKMLFCYCKFVFKCFFLGDFDFFLKRRRASTSKKADAFSIFPSLFRDDVITMGSQFILPFLT